MSAELVPISGADISSMGDRVAALQELGQMAEDASTCGEAQEVMVKGRALAEVLAGMKAPFEESWLAGKASVLAARKLALLLCELDSNNACLPGGGRNKSEFGLVCDELGIGTTLRSDLKRLSRAEDSDFQRYIQKIDKIPTLYGALRYCAVSRHKGHDHRKRDYRSTKRARAGVVPPKNPSVDEAYSLIVRALGHLSGYGSSRRGAQKMKTAIAASMDHLYAAEDLIKPYRGGYGD